MPARSPWVCSAGFPLPFTDSEALRSLRHIPPPHDPYTFIRGTGGSTAPTGGLTVRHVRFAAASPPQLASPRRTHTTSPHPLSKSSPSPRFRSCLSGVSISSPPLGRASSRAPKSSSASPPPETSRHRTSPSLLPARRANSPPSGQLIWVGTDRARSRQSSNRQGSTARSSATGFQPDQLLVHEHRPSPRQLPHTPGGRTR